MTRITTNARRKLRRSHLGRSGPESATQATTAKMRQINVQESIVRRSAIASKAKSMPSGLDECKLLAVMALRVTLMLAFLRELATG
jgi:hypothetical protein